MSAIAVSTVAKPKAAPCHTSCVTSAADAEAAAMQSPALAAGGYMDMNSGVAVPCGMDLKVQTMSW